jgi:hypothetical protein
LLSLLDDLLDMTRIESAAAAGDGGLTSPS